MESGGYLGDAVHHARVMHVAVARPLRDDPGLHGVHGDHHAAGPGSRHGPQKSVLEGRSGPVHRYYEHLETHDRTKID